MQTTYRWILSFALSVGSYTALADNVNVEQELTTQLDSAILAIQQTSSSSDEDGWAPYNEALVAAKNEQYDTAADLLAPLLQRSNNNPDKIQIYKAAWQLAKLLGIIKPSVDPLPTIRASLARRVLAENLFTEIYKLKDHQDPTLVVISSQDSQCTYCIPADKALTKFARESKRSGKRYNILYVGSEPYIDGLKEPTKTLAAIGVTGLPTYLVIHRGEYVYAWNGINDKQFTYLLNNIDQIKKGAGRQKLVFSKQDTLLDYTRFKYGEYAIKGNDFKAMSFALNQDALHIEYAYDSPNQESANQSALNLCRKNDVVVKYAMNCELYAEGHNIVSKKAIERVKNKDVQIRNDREAQAVALAETSQNKSTINKGTNSNKSSSRTVAKSSVKQQKQNSTINDAELKTAITNYKNAKDNFKSFASTGTHANAAFGAATKAPTQAEANSRALTQCQQFAAALATTEQCLLSYIGDTEVQDHDEESISKLTLKVQRKGIKKSLLKSSYSKYRRLSEDKAYALSHDEADTFVYAIAFGKRGIDKASELALRDCEKKRQQKSLVRPCRLFIVNGEFQE